MSLSEQDREILLQEIQQIQQTLEATGRNFGEDNHDKSESDDEDYDDADLYYPANLKQEEEIIANDDESTLQTTSAYSESIYCESDDISEVYNNQYATSDQLSLPQLSSTPTGIEKVAILNDIPPQSSISAKLKQRIKHESEFSGKPSPKLKERKKDASIVGSIDSTKQMEKINMANLYVERLFGGFRSKKEKGSYRINAKYGKDLKSDASLSSLENLLQVNRRYKELLGDELKKVELAIERNRKAQDEVETSLKEKEVKVATFSSLSRACIGRFGNPYFKDQEGLQPPDNEDTSEKKRTWKVNPFVRGSKHWKKTEAEALEEGVYNNNLELRLEPWMKKLKDFDREYREKFKQGEHMDRTPRHKISTEIEKIKELPKSELLIDSSLIDFFKISKNFLPTRDEFECRVQWWNMAHPAINQTKFTKDEDSQLIKLAKRNNNYLWENIAQELGTKRTPIQCLQRFQRTLNREMIKTVWDEEDDKKLTSLVRLHGYNWVLIAAELGNRIGDQCMHRWIKTLDPHIKRGKWSDVEDKLLLDAVEKLGQKNWKEVRKLVPGRTDAQCRERFVATLDPSKNWGAFTEEEDRKIIEMVGKHGLGKWSTIAKEFPSRRDNQIWRRYTQIEADKYHQYRRGVIWKRRSVMNYFFHRRSEKREYSLEELDVTYSPSLTHMESRKIERMREELLKCSYSEDEITKKLARMHYEGLFSKSIYKPRQRPYSQGRCKRIRAESEKADNSARKSLVSGIVKVLSSVEDPENDLPDVPGGELKRKTKYDREVNVDGYHVVKKPVTKKKGRKETWMEGVVNGDVFRRKCYELMYKYKSRSIWFGDAVQKVKEIYESVQVNDNSFYHKQILAIYVEVSKRLKEIADERLQIEMLLLENKEVPIIHEEDVEKERLVTDKRQPGRPRGSKNGSVAEKKKKLSTFKQMVLAASRDLNTPETCGNKDGETNTRSPCPSIGMVTTVDHTDQSESEGNDHVQFVPSVNNSQVLLSPVNNQTPLSSVYNQIPLFPVNNQTPLSHKVTSPPSQTSILEARFNKICETPEKLQLSPGSVVYKSITSLTEPSISQSEYLSTDNITAQFTTPSKSQHVNENLPSSIEKRVPNSTNTSFIQDASFAPDSSLPYNDGFTHDAIDPHNPPVTDYTLQMNVKSEPSTPQTYTSDPSTPNRNDTHQFQQQEDPSQSFLSDQLKTFTLLLQALHVDTTGVMGALSNTTSPSNTSRTSSSFPTCYPLSPNSASLLGFRKLLLHRRILGDIVKKEQLESEKFGIHTRSTSYRETRSYDALRKRFRSLFTWPAFLATFVPKFPKPISPSKRISNVIKNHVKICPNRTMEITPSMTVSATSISSSGSTTDNSSSLGSRPRTITPSTTVSDTTVPSSGSTANNSSSLGSQPKTPINLSDPPEQTSIGNENDSVKVRSEQQTDQTNINENNRTSESTSSFIDEYLQSRKRKIDRKIEKMFNKNNKKNDNSTTKADNDIVVKRKRKKKKSTKSLTTSSSSCEKDCFVDEYVKKSRRRREKKMKTTSRSRSVISDSASSLASANTSPLKITCTENNIQNIVVGEQRTSTTNEPSTNETRLKSLEAGYVSKRKSQTNSVDGESLRHGGKFRKKKMKMRRMHKRDERRNSSNSQTEDGGIFIPPAMSVKSESDVEQGSLNFEIVESSNL